MSPSHTNYFITGKLSVTVHMFPKGTIVTSIRQCTYERISYKSATFFTYFSLQCGRMSSWKELGCLGSIPSFTTDTLFLLPLHLNLPLVTQYIIGNDIVPVCFEGTWKLSDRRFHTNAETIIIPERLENWKSMYSSLLNSQHNSDRRESILLWSI